MRGGDGHRHDELHRQRLRGTAATPLSLVPTCLVPDIDLPLLDADLRGPDRLTLRTLATR